MLKTLVFCLTNPKAKRKADKLVKQVRPILDEAIIYKNIEFGKLFEVKYIIVVSVVTYYDPSNGGHK